MADNTRLSAGTADGDTYASDDIAGVKHQRVKISVGADGAATDAVPVSNGMDVTGAAVQAVGLVAQFDDTSTGAVTENQFAPVRISSRRALLVEGVASGTVIPVSDGGGTLTVDGTVAVTNAGLTALNGAIAGSEVQVDVLTMPTVAVTQSGAWDEVGIHDSGNSITVDGTVTAQTGQSLDYDTGAGTQTTQLVGIALPASGGPVAGGTTTNPIQVADAGGSLTVDGTVTANLSATDNAVLDSIDAAVNGTLDVNIVSGAGSGGTALADGATFTPDTTSLTPIGGYRDDTSPATVTEGDAAACRITENRALHVNLRAADGSELSVGGGTQYDEDAAHVSGAKVTLAGVVRQDTAAQLAGTDGDYSVLINDASGRLHVNVGNTVTVASHAVTNAGTFAVQVDGSALTALQLIDNAVKNEDDASAGGDGGFVVLAKRADTVAATSGTDGDYEPLQVKGGRLHTAPGGTVAHDAADEGNPVKIGGRADSTFQTAVADGDRVDALFDVYGQQRTRRDHVNLWSYHDDDTAAVTTDGTVQAAPGAGLSVYITDLVFSIGAATASSIFVEESTTKILGPYYLEAVAGRSIHLKFDTPKKCTANTAILVTNTGSISFSVDMLGFIAP